MNKELKNIRKRWYKFLPVRYEMVKSMRDREVVFMDRKDNSKVIRCLCIRSVQFLDYVFDSFNFYERDYNIYISIAKYKNIPQFTYNLKERSNFTSEWFNNIAEKEIYEYDILLDFDIKDIYNFPKLTKEINFVLHILFKENICFQYYPSGHGFQIIIKGEDYKSKYSVKRNYLNTKCKNSEIKNITKNIEKRFNLKFLDLKIIGKFNSIRKCPYSLTKDRVCLPQTNKDLKNFDYKDMFVNSVVIDNIIRDRGQKYFNNPNENINKFIDKYFIEV